MIKPKLGIANPLGFFFFELKSTWFDNIHKDKASWGARRIAVAFELIARLS